MSAAYSNKQLNLCICILLVCTSNIRLLSQNVSVNGYGHSEYSFFSQDKTQQSYFSLGEHDLFIRSQIAKRISFLGEYVVRYSEMSPTKFAASIERSFFIFSPKNNKSLIIGKIHTPVNYWNDVYHHGRLFFPTIDRPMAFSYFIPLHTLGIQYQIQNKGKWNFGYDIVIGNSMNSTDFQSANIFPSLTSSFHIKPAEGWRIGMSYYVDYLKTNTPGVHSGHTMSNVEFNEIDYKGPLLFNLLSFSTAYFGNKFELLNEFSNNITITDTLGTASNYSNFVYMGYKIRDKHIPYFLLDFVRVADNDLFTGKINNTIVGIGYKHDFDVFTNVKVQLNYHFVEHHHHSANKFGFRIQWSYGF